MRKILFAVLIMLGATGVSAQMKEGDRLAGPTVGIVTQSGSISLGANLEYEIAQMGSGVFGLGATFRYWTSSTLNSSVLGGQLNYNFNKIGDGKIVPFIGIMVGFNFAGSDLWAWGQSGVRYFFHKNLAGVARIGLGNNSFASPEIGVDFKF